LTLNNIQHNCSIIFSHLIKNCFFVTNNIKGIFAGSNASLLSSEISTALTGRNMTLYLMPFSFKEYLSIKNINCYETLLTTEQKAILIGEFNQYVEIGGFPQVIKENNNALKLYLYGNGFCDNPVSYTT